MNRGYTLIWRKLWANPVLFEPGKKFSRLEAWLYLTNVLAAGIDDEAAGLKRGEFIASIRFLAKTFNWSHAMAQRFVDQLLANSMIARVIRESIRPAIQDAGHFIVCNYETYNQTRYADRYGKRYGKRYKIKVANAYVSGNTNHRSWYMGCGSQYGDHGIILPTLYGGRCHDCLRGYHGFHRD